MSDEDLSFEEDLIRRCFSVRAKQRDNRRKKPPRRKEKPLSSRLALKEAEELFTLVYDIKLTAPDGAVGWLVIKDGGSMADPADAGLGTGITGIGLFAAALHSVSTDSVILKKTQDIVDRVRGSLTAQLLSLKQKSGSGLSGILACKLGEASGFGGILRGLVLMERYQGSGLFASLVRDTSELLYKSLDFGCTDMTDRMGGIAGLIATLCAYTELRGVSSARELIAAGAARLMELKNFNADGHTLWNTISKRHLISGAGHGMMGIAHALFNAGSLLGESKWIEAAEEAVAFELETYSDKLHTWPDR
ncbi:MAG: hypothetical protein K6E34_08545 [Lachnospiraceae bacterium]|nr:hypothetical protein [Lachnospiraceae bacterium]